MNVLQKKKRFLISIISTVLSLVFVGYAYIKNVQTVKADVNNVITYNSYGSTERGRVNVGYNNTTYITDAWIRFNFNGNYNGVISINLTGASPMSNFAIAVDNCHIISTSTNYIQIEFYGINQCELHFNSTATTMGTFNIQSVYFDSMHKVSDSDSAQLVNIVNRLTTLNSYNDQIETLLTSNNTLLQTIANNGGSGGSSTVNNIDINVDHIADELSLLKTSNDSILDELIGFFTDSLGQIITVENLVNAIEDTTTALLGVQTQLTNINTTLNSINTTLNNINTAVQNIDNSIDTITWNNRNVVTYKYLSSDGTFKNITDNNYSGINHILTLNLNFATINRGTNNYISKIRLGDNAQFTDYFEVTDMYYLINNNKVHLDYYQQNNNEITLYVYNYNLSNNNHSTAPLYIEVKIPQNKYITIYPSNASCGYIFDTDIEYWQLIQCFNQYKSQKQILDAINSLSIQVTQQDINNTNNNISNYNNTMNTVEGIETNIITNLNTDLSNLTLSSDYINPVDTNVRTAFDIVIQDFILDHNYIAGRFYLILVCSLVLLMLGRW